MPTLHLAGLAHDLVTRVRAYARARGLSTPVGAAQLLERGLQTTDARRAGALAANAARSPQERSDLARRAVYARYHSTLDTPSSKAVDSAHVDDGEAHTRGDSGSGGDARSMRGAGEE